MVSFSANILPFWLYAFVPVYAVKKILKAIGLDGYKLVKKNVNGR